MSYEYSENILVQQSAANTLREKLGWETIYAYDTEVLGMHGTLGRTSYNDILLTRYTRDALFRYNDWMTESYADVAVKTLLSTIATSNLLKTNEDKYHLIRDGIPIVTKTPDGTTQTLRAKLIDFTNPENNHFLAVQELKIHGRLYRRRTDIVGFVNGIPLLFIELKKQNVDIKDAYDCNYTDYLDTIPHLFYYNAFLIISNGLEAKIGTLGSKYEFFHEWKRLKEEDPGRVDLETMLLGICCKQNFLDLFENFILFDKSNGNTTKILARNHQYLGVNEAFESYKHRKLKEGKLGVFWHTQGSGKSYSMVFLSQKIRRKLQGSPTIIILTDRDELNKQISDTFEACGCLGDVKASTFIPQSGTHLIQMLKGNPSFIFTLIQKFNNRTPEPIIPDHDILILSDEAHRTQNGIFADNMCSLLPTASRLGFTGTPLFTYDNITERTFGTYVSIYDFQRAVTDGATVPLYYENRSDLLAITNPAINDDLLAAIENADLDINQQAKLEKEFAKEIHILTAEERLKTIAKDFVDHYTDLWTTGKAMFVCVNKITAVRMYNLATEYWKLKIAETEQMLQTATQQEYLELNRKLSWLKQTEMAVVISQEQNEIQTFAKWGLDILPHREKMEHGKLDKDFKDPDNPFRIVFVCAMWLTGFDVQSLSTIYLDKPLKAHTLMQTIARANRVAEGKSNGLIVDYIGVVKALREALAAYTTTRDGKTINDPAPDKQKLLDRIVDLIITISNYLKENDFIIEDLINACDFERLALIDTGANILCSTEQIKKRFEIQARELFKLFKYVERNELTPKERAYKNAISALYDQIQTRRKHADNTDLMIEVSSIVSSYITVTKNNTNTENKCFDISKIDFERLSMEFEKVKNKNLLVKDLQDLVEDRLATMLNTNPSRIDYYEKYRKIIDDYNAEQDKVTIEKTFIDLMSLVDSLNIEEKRYIREGFSNDEELAIYDLLIKTPLTPEEIKQIKGLAKTLLMQIKEKIRELDHWTDKEKTQADVDILIRDTLWNGLPDSYDDNTISLYRRKIYEYVSSAYPTV